MTLFIVEAILIEAVLILVQNTQTPTSYAVIEPQEKIDFKTSTKAVCEEKTGYIFCHDELFVKCNGEEYKIAKDNLNSPIKCGDADLKLSGLDVNGQAKFKKNWIDPRTLEE